MIIVKVTYSVKNEYVNDNKEMIQKFLSAFHNLDHDQFLYSVFQTGDQNTFVHLSQYKNEEIQHKLLHMDSFLQFQNKRDQNLVAEPSVEFLSFIGASRSIF